MEVNQLAETNYLIIMLECLAVVMKKVKWILTLGYTRLMMFLSEDTAIMFLVLYLV